MKPAFALCLALLTVGSAPAAEQAIGFNTNYTRPPEEFAGTVRARNHTVTSGVEWFRQLLAQSPAEREPVLGTMAAARREFFLRKLAEYDALPAPEREWKLRLTEVRYHLIPLMQTPRANRADTLASLSPETRQLLEDRLNHWDLLPPPLQQPLLENQMVLDYFSQAQAQGQTPEQQAGQIAKLPVPMRRQLEQGLARWNALPAGEQQRITRQSSAFFELNERDKRIVLGQMPALERDQVQRVMTSIGQLGSDEREQCLAALRKFATMTAGERQQFLGAVGRWETMTPEQQARWRDIAPQLPPLPPLPPGFAPAIPPITSVR